MNDDEIIEAIKQDVEVNNFGTDLSHLAAHMTEERFGIRDVVVAVIYGDVIESRPEDDRWLFCGNVHALHSLSGYRGRWLHVSVEYIEEIGTTVVTAYRPKISQWRTERERR